MINPKKWKLPRDPKWWQAKALSVAILVALLGRLELRRFEASIRLPPESPMTS